MPTATTIPFVRRTRRGCGRGRAPAAAPSPIRVRAASGALQRPPMLEPIPAAARALLGLGLNPLVQAASPLLLLTAQMRDTLSPMDVPGLRRHALDEIRRFEEQARASGVPNEIVLAARYALCAVPRRGGAVDTLGRSRASGRSTRCWSRCTARRGAARSSSRCWIGSRRIRRATST